MENIQFEQRPIQYDELVRNSKALNFNMCSDVLTGSMLQTLVSSKPGGRILELGTGTGLSLSWILAGADENTNIVSIDNDPQLIELTRSYFNDDERVQLICQDGGDWIETYGGPQFDLIFADAWPGKFQLLDHTLSLLKPGGIYMIDDLNSQPNWPEGHEIKVKALVNRLIETESFSLTKLNWSTGLIIATRKK